jgi:hypothetical protein
MTIREYLKIDSCDRDLSTGIELSHDEKYTKIIDAIGKQAVYTCIPFTKDQIKHSKDPYLNDLSMKKWDAAAGYLQFTNDKTRSQDIKRFPSRLKDLLNKIGIDCFSCSELVCVLKVAARLWITEDN